LSASLGSISYEDATRTQSRMVYGIFGARIAPDVLKRAFRVENQLRSSGHTGHCVLFHRLQLTALARYAVRNLPRTLEPRGSDLGDLGLALLMMSDLVESGSHSMSRADPTTDVGRQQWHRYFMANGLFHHKPNQLHAVARSFDLYLSDRAHLRGH